MPVGRPDFQPWYSTNPSASPTESLAPRGMSAPRVRASLTAAA